MTTELERIAVKARKNFFGSLDHGWQLRFVEYRVGDLRIKQGNPLPRPKLKLSYTDLQRCAVL